MSDPSTDHEAPEVAPEALREWTKHAEEVLRGVAHSLNNRAAAISALLELSHDIGTAQDDSAAFQGILQTELQRVRTLTAVVRAIGAPRAGSEAFAPQDAAADAIEVMKVHPDHRHWMIQLDASGAPPIRVERWRFLRALIALCCSSPETTEEKKSVHLRMREEGDWLDVRLEGTGAASFARMSPYTAALVASMGGAPMTDGYGFRVPTLAAIRRREAR